MSWSVTVSAPAPRLSVLRQHLAYLYNRVYHVCFDTSPAASNEEGEQLVGKVRKGLAKSSSGLQLGQPPTPETSDSVPLCPSRARSNSTSHVQKPLGPSEPCCL